MSDSIITDQYVHPTSWSDLNSEYLGYGDYAGWVDAIRTAMWERVNVCLNGVYRGSQLQSYVTSLGYFEHLNYSHGVPLGYRGDAEVYNFARNTEALLDYLLTPYREYGTADNYWGPGSEQGYFVAPDSNYWFRTITYASETQAIEEETTCYVKFLNMEKMFEDQTRNYKLALSGVARGDTPDKFVPFFNAVKNALNYMTVIPVSLRCVRVNIHPLGVWDENLSEVTSELTEKYNEVMEGQPDPNYLYNYGFGNNVSIENYCRLVNSAETGDTEEDYGGYLGWSHHYPYQVTLKLPPINFNLYRGYWACLPQYWIDGYDDAEFSFGSEYTPHAEFVGLISGFGHFLGGDNGRRFGSKFPSDRPSFPSTPARQEHNIKGYELHCLYFADFNVEGGFNFRTNS